MTAGLYVYLLVVLHIQMMKPRAGAGRRERPEYWFRMQRVTEAWGREYG